MNLMMLLEMAAASAGEREALVCEGERWTHGELFAAAGRAAARVRASGVEPVALLDVSSPAVPIALFASAWAGRPFVPLNYRLTGPERDVLIERVTPALLITDRERAAALGRREGVQAVAREHFLAGGRAPGPAPDPDWAMEPDDVAIWLFTSGTTGAPKAALLRHRHLVSYILGSVEFMSASEADAALVSVPPYHVAGMAALLSSIYAGRRIVQLPAFSPERWLALVESERVTNAFVVPTMLARVVDALEAIGGKPPRTLRALAYGGGKMPLPVIERAMRLFGQADLTNAYGLTETSSTIAVRGPDDHREGARSGAPGVRRRPPSVGRPLPGVEVEIRDPDGKPVPAGQRGEVCVRGEQVSGEYLGRASRIGPGGWFPTNDGGFLDEAGYLFVEGRIDDVIVRGGENLSPGEIEDVLLGHPAVADAAVVGVPDLDWGEGVAAAIVLKEGAEASAGEIQAWVKKHLRSSRVPQLVRFEPELPYNEAGKLLRRRVREALARTS